VARAAAAGGVANVDIELSGRRRLVPPFYASFAIAAGPLLRDPKASSSRLAAGMSCFGGDGDAFRLKR
jgi:hypothetical protein